MKLSLILTLFVYLFLSKSNISASANQLETEKRNIVNSISAKKNHSLTISRLIPLPLEDGAEKTLSTEATSHNRFENTDSHYKSKVPYISLKLPVSMLDRNVDYTVSVSSIKPDVQYNIAYIIDTSSNMSEQELKDVKNAYVSLINYLIDNNLATNSNFAVISFNRQVTSRKDLTAQEAISTIQKLQISSSSQAKYSQALEESYKFIDQSPLDKSRIPSIVYLFAKNKSLHINSNTLNVSEYRQNIINLKKYAHIQVFGIQDNLEDPNNKFVLQDLDFIDSDQAVILDNSLKFIEAIKKTELTENIAEIAEIKILLDGKLVKKIKPEQLLDTPLGLIFKGSIDGLDISEYAKNLVRMEVIFNNGLPNQSIDFMVNSGEAQGASGSSQTDLSSIEAIRANVLEGSDRNDEIVLSYTDLAVNSRDGNDHLIGNREDNIIDGGTGNDTIFAHRGNDTITAGEGSDRIDGGEGVDTVVYKNTLYQNSNIRTVAKVLNIDHADILTDVELIQFADVRISTETLKIAPILKGNHEMTVKEGDSEFTDVQLNFELSTPTSADVKFNYNTMEEDYPSEIIAGKYYLPQSGQVTIPAGETQATINLKIIGNTIDNENNSQIFALRLSKISGATFEDNSEESGTVIYIEDDDNALRINAGGNAYTDSLGQKWFPSEPWEIFMNGQTNLTLNQIARTNDDILYQSEYFGKDFSFNFPVFTPNCAYEVTLRFAETDFSQSKQRIFDVMLEDRLVLDDFDIFATANGKNIPISKTFEVEVTDNSLDIDFLASVNDAKISAVEIKSKSTEIRECEWFTGLQ